MTPARSHARPAFDGRAVAFTVIDRQGDAGYAVARTTLLLTAKAWACRRVGSLALMRPQPRLQYIEVEQ